MLSWEHFILHSNQVLVDTLILQSEQKLFGFEIMSNFRFPYFREILASFGGTGISHFQHGLEIIYIYLLEVQRG